MYNLLWSILYQTCSVFILSSLQWVCVINFPRIIKSEHFISLNPHNKLWICLTALSMWNYLPTYLTACFIVYLVFFGPCYISYHTSVDHIWKGESSLGRKLGGVSLVYVSVTFVWHFIATPPGRTLDPGGHHVLFVTNLALLHSFHFNLGLHNMSDSVKLRDWKFEIHDCVSVPPLSLPRPLSLPLPLPMSLPCTCPVLSLLCPCSSPAYVPTSASIPASASASVPASAFSQGFPRWGDSPPPSRRNFAKSHPSELKVPPSKFLICGGGIPPFTKSKLLAAGENFLDKDGKWSQNYGD